MTIPAPPLPADTEEVVKPPRRLTGVATLVALLAALAIAVGLGAWFRGEANQLVGSAAATNEALVDTAGTAEVSAQVREAVRRVYSYDFARLDANEKAANEVITGGFVENFRQQFARVRDQAPGQQAVVIATVPALAVKMLDGDQAVVVVFLDQEAHQAGRDKPLLATGRLSITAQRIAGSWKIANAESF
jgi:Mce-associated membrane protein